MTEEKVEYQPLSQISESTPKQPDLEDQAPSSPPSTNSSSSAPSLSPPSYDSIAQPETEGKPIKRKCRRVGRCSRCCLGFCSCYGIFCFTWSLLVLCLLCLTTSYYTTIVDHCINPPFAYETIEYISFQDQHPNLQDLNIFISVTSGSIRLETTESEDLTVKVIRGAGDEDSLEEQTSFSIEYNATHLSLIGVTPTTLFDCPTVQIVVQVPIFATSAPNKWMLSVETGHVHISEFYGSLSDMQIHLTTGAVQIDTLVVNNLEVMTNAGAIYWTSSQSFVSEQAKLITNSGYIKAEEINSIGSFQFGTNTGVINLRDINTIGKVEADAIWGILRLDNVRSDSGVYVVSDAAFVSFENNWEASTLSFTTEDGSLDLDHLSTEYVESTDNDGVTRIFFNGYTDSPSLYFITTVSGVVTLYES